MQECAFEGDTRGGKPHGSGKMRYPSGDEYDGDWMDSYQHGEGTYTHPNGYSYMGNWNKGKNEGQGVEQRPSGSKDTGEFLDDFRHGEGTHQKADGTIYTGSWLKGVFEGLGEVRSVDGRTYTGSFSNNLCHGYGVQTWPKGANGNIIKYVGEWCEGEPCGSDGVYTRCNGSLCLGPIMPSPPQASTAQTVGANGAAQLSKPFPRGLRLFTVPILILIAGILASAAKSAPKKRSSTQKQDRKLNSA